jgi:hypothetical protein
MLIYILNMSIYARGSFTGNYEPQGNIAEADCVIGNEFAFRTNGFGSVNEQLARVIADHYIDLPLLINRNIAGALKELKPNREPEEIFTGDSVNFMSDEGEGTWGELLQAKKYMNQRELQKPILIAQAYHVGRVALQAKKLGINPVIPEGLPTAFDPESVQRWTHNKFLWAIREAPGVLVLKHKGQL